MKDLIKEKLLKEIKSMEKAKSLRDSCYDYFYKKFGDSWEEEFYEKHLKDLKSNCVYLNLKLKLKQHKETSKAKDEEFIKILYKYFGDDKYIDWTAEELYEGIKEDLKENKK